jgi:hypothetical protein
MRSMLDHSDPPQEQAAIRQELTMPPDLRLAQPGTAPVETQQATQDAYTGSATPAPVMPAEPAAERPKYGDDIYAQAGISVTKPDGTRKTDAELRAELQQYYIAKKRQKNPNYGTVFNMGNIFKDE